MRTRRRRFWTRTRWDSDMRIVFACCPSEHPEQVFVSLECSAASGFFPSDFGRVPTGFCFVPSASPLCSCWCSRSLSCFLVLSTVFSFFTKVSGNAARRQNQHANPWRECDYIHPPAPIEGERKRGQAEEQQTRDYPRAHQHVGDSVSAFASHVVLFSVSFCMISLLVVDGVSDVLIGFTTFSSK